MSVDLDKEMLRVMEVKNFFEEGVSWKTLKVQRYTSDRKQVYETSELASHWHPSTNMAHAMDVLNSLKSKGIDIKIDVDNSYWRVHISNCESYSDSLPEAICRTTYSLIGKG